MRGLRVNLCKSELVPVGDVGGVEELASLLYCKVGSLPMAYLSMPLGSSYKSNIVWNFLLGRIEKHLAE